MGPLYYLYENISLCPHYLLTSIWKRVSVFSFVRISPRVCPCCYTNDLRKCKFFTLCMLCHLSVILAVRLQHDTAALISVCVCLKRNETDSDLIQFKTNTLFRLKTLSWKQTGFPGYQREGQIQTLQMEAEGKERYGQKTHEKKRFSTVAGGAFLITLPKMKVRGI